MTYLTRQQEPEETQLITIEFTPVQDEEDSCPQPKFIFGDRVVTKEQGEYCQSKGISVPSILFMTICAIELVQSLTSSGKLLSKPRWKYGIRSTLGTRELIWFEESDLFFANPVD